MIPKAVEETGSLKPFKSIDAMKKKNAAPSRERLVTHPKADFASDEDSGSRFVFLGLKALDELKILARLASSKLRHRTE